MESNPSKLGLNFRTSDTEKRNRTSISKNAAVLAINKAKDCSNLLLERNQCQQIEQQIEIPKFPFFCFSFAILVTIIALDCETKIKIGNRSKRDPSKSRRNHLRSKRNQAINLQLNPRKFFPLVTDMKFMSKMLRTCFIRSHQTVRFVQH